MQLHNGENDSYIRQSQLWHQIICQTKTAIFFCEIDWSYLCLATVWQILNLKKKNFAAIWQKDILTLDGLEKEQLIQLDDVTRIKLALRNQGQLAPFVCYLDFKIGNFAFDVIEIIWAKIFLSNCSKQLVTTVNLTRKKNHKLFNFQDWERAPKAKKLPLIEIISTIVYWRN